MESVKVSKLDNEMLLNNTSMVIKCYTTAKRKDVNGQEYEELEEQYIYCKVSSFYGKSLYVKKERLLEIVLHNDIRPLVDGSLFDHGYPEDRPTPKNYISDTLDGFTEDLSELFYNMLCDIVHDNTPKQYRNEM